MNNIQSMSDLSLILREIHIITVAPEVGDTVPLCGRSKGGDEWG